MPVDLIPFLFFILHIIISWFLVGRLIPLLSSHFLDKPNQRSSHTSLVPRSGGLVFVFLSSISSAFTCINMLSSPKPFDFVAFAPLIFLPLALVGLADDKYNLTSSFRLCVQLATAILVSLCSPLYTFSILSVSLFLFLLVFIVSLINFTNFMDGLDGLVAGSMFFSISVVAFKTSAPWPILSLLASLLGFLFWNWSPAKVFMGDVGSTFLGAVFSLLVLQADSWAEAFSFLLVATPLLSDAFFCVFRRLIAGQRVFEPHRLHLYQRLHQAGWSHAKVSCLYISSTAVLAIALVVGGLPSVILFAGIELVIGLWLDQRVAVPFTLSSST